MGRDRRSLLLQDLEDLDVVYSAGPSCAQGGKGRACAIGCDEPRSLWTSLTTTHCMREARVSGERGGQPTEKNISYGPRSPRVVGSVN